MDPQKQKEIASKGGKAAHLKGTAHEFTPEEAKEAGRKGGRAAHQKRMAAANIRHRDIGEPELFQQVESDHERIDSLMMRLGDNAQSEKDSLFENLRDEIETHAMAEEHSFYPALAKIPECEGIMSQSRREHSEIRDLLSQLEGMVKEPGGEWLSRLSNLKEKVQQHVAREEDQIFSKMKEVFDESTFTRLEEEFTQVKRRENQRPAA